MNGKFATTIRAGEVHLVAFAGDTAPYPEDEGLKRSSGLDSDLKPVRKFRLDWNTKTL